MEQNLNGKIEDLNFKIEKSKRSKITLWQRLEIVRDILKDSDHECELYKRAIVERQEILSCLGKKIRATSNREEERGEEFLKVEYSSLEKQDILCKINSCYPIVFNEQEDIWQCKISSSRDCVYYRNCRYSPFVKKACLKMPKLE